MTILGFFSLMGGVGLFGLPIVLAVVNKMNKEGVIHLYNVRRDGERESRPRRAA